jgi:hypothetical protein
MIKVILFGGTGVTACYANSFAITTVDTAVNVTTGFATDVVIMAAQSGSFNDSANTHMSPTFGFAVNDGSATQRSWNVQDSSGVNPTTEHAIFTTDSIAERAAGGGTGDRLAIENFGATGFDIYKRTLGTTEMSGVYLALNLAAGISAKVLTDATPTGTGTDSITGAGFRPQFGLIAHSSAPLVDTYYTDGNAEVWGIGAFTSTAAFSIAVTADDNVTTTNTEAISSNKPVYIRKDAGDFLIADFTQFTNDGADLNITTKADSTAYQRAVLFIQAGGRRPISPMVLQ